jgi:hypothetical protein
LAGGHRPIQQTRTRPDGHAQIIHFGAYCWGRVPSGGVSSRL